VKARTIFVLLTVCGIYTVAQQPAKRQLSLRIITDKDSYALKENIVVKAELTNLTSKTLCFPVPDPECSTPQTEWVNIDAEPLSSTEREQFICHVDGRGAVGNELDSNIRDRWIKLAPNVIYLLHPTAKKLTLNEAGDWRLTASYHPPEGSFNAQYKSVLRTSAQNAGCQLPESVAVAEPKIINVRPADPDYP
jgi:hypothetical protein